MFERLRIFYILDIRLLDKYINNGVATISYDEYRREQAKLRLLEIRILASKEICKSCFEPPKVEVESGSEMARVLSRVLCKRFPFHVKEESTLWEILEYGNGP